VSKLTIAGADREQANDPPAPIVSKPTIERHRP
jgi:hypothetical protein